MCSVVRAAVWGQACRLAAVLPAGWCAARVWAVQRCVADQRSALHKVPASICCPRRIQPTSPSPVPQGVGVAKPYLRVQENCWALTVHPDGQWRVSYDL